MLSNHNTILVEELIIKNFEKKGFKNNYGGGNISKRPYYEKDGFKFIKDDSFKELKMIEPKSIDMIFAAPPLKNILTTLYEK